MISRRSVSLAGGCGLLVAHRLGRGQTAAPIRRVGYLGATSPAIGGHLREAFKQGMRDRGWLEGSNIEYQIAYAGSDIDRLDALADELVGQKVEVIVATSAHATRAAQKATKTIPIVMAGVSNAVGNGFVASLARPGGNITGISNQGEDALAKLVEILHELVPAARRIAILLNESHPSHPAFWAGGQAACATLGLIALRFVASAPAQLAPAIELIVGQRSHAVAVVADAMFFVERARLQELLQTTRLPVAYGLREHLAAGGLLSYGADLTVSFRYAAKWVDKILKGAKPADLPVEQPTKFELVVNMRTANALGLKVPRSLLVRADEVIE